MKEFEQVKQLAANSQPQLNVPNTSSKGGTIDSVSNDEDDEDDDEDDDDNSLNDAYVEILKKLCEELVLIMPDYSEQIYPTN